MAIEPLSKSSKASFGGEEQGIIWWVLGLAAFCLLAYLGLYFYQNTIEKKILEAELKLDSHYNEDFNMKKQAVLAAKRKIDDFSYVFGEHRNPSQFFDYFHNLCHPRVSFSSLGLNVKNGTADLAGSAESFLVLAQQLYVLGNQEDNINNVYLTGLSLGKAGEVGFGLSLTFSPRLFKFNQ